MRPPPLARQASHPSAGDTGAPPAGGNLAVAVPHEGAVGLFIVPEETGLRRLCAEMKAGTSTPGEDRESGPITRSGICQRVDDLPQAGHSRRDQVHTDNDGEL